MTRLILIRHGQSEANKLGLFAGHSDFDLTELGFLQAELTARTIAEQYKIDKVYASDLKRAFNTGKALSDLCGVEIIPCAELREIYAGEWEATSCEELPQKYVADFSVWFNDIGNSTPTQGESVSSLARRIENIIQSIADQNVGKTVAIATHGTPIKAIQAIVEKGDISQMKNIPWATNASFSVLEYDNRIWSFSKIGVDAHLKGFITKLPNNI